MGHGGVRVCACGCEAMKSFFGTTPRVRREPASVRECILINRQG
jgi:hypothetical protein